jgi:hypothetical protein
MDLLQQFIPLLLISAIYGGFMALVAFKLGKSKLLWFALGAAPGVNVFFFWISLWWVIIELHRRIKSIEDR